MFFAHDVFLGIKELKSRLGAQAHGVSTSVGGTVLIPLKKKPSSASDSLSRLDKGICNDILLRW